MPVDPPAIRVEGLREVRRRFRDLHDTVGKDMLREANKNLADRLMALAQPNVPVGATGKLKASVRGLGSVSAASGKAGKASVPYAAAVHWGTGPRPGRKGPHNIARRPFLFDALQRLRAAGAVEEYADQLDRVLDRLTRGR